MEGVAGKRAGAKVWGKGLEVGTVVDCEAEGGSE